MVFFKKEKEASQRQIITLPAPGGDGKSPGGGWVRFHSIPAGLQRRQLKARLRAVAVDLAT